MTEYWNDRRVTINGLLRTSNAILYHLCAGVTAAHNPQRGAAATEGSRRDKCVRSKLGAVSRRAERVDFVTHGANEVGVSGRTV
jgi:hypothetical protein